MHILAHEIFGNKKERCVLELNASDARGQDVVRNIILLWKFGVSFCCHLYEK